MSNVPPPIPPEMPGQTTSPQSPPPMMPQQVLGYAEPATTDVVRLRKIAKWQHLVNLMALLFILAAFLLFVFFTPPRGKPVPTELLLPRAIISWFILASWVGLIVFMIFLALAMDNTAMAIVMGILTLIPIFNLIPVAIQSMRATKRLRADGYKVGLLGADLKQFAQ